MSRHVRRWIPKAITDAQPAASVVLVALVLEHTPINGPSAGRLVTSVKREANMCSIAGVNASWCVQNLVPGFKLHVALKFEYCPGADVAPSSGTVQVEQAAVGCQRYGSSLSNAIRSERSSNSRDETCSQLGGRLKRRRCYFGCERIDNCACCKN